MARMRGCWMMRLSKRAESEPKARTAQSEPKAKTEGCEGSVVCVEGED